MGLKDQAWLRFYSNLIEFIEELIYKGIGSGDQACPRFYLIENLLMH